MRQRIKELDMDKRGVVLDDEKTKTADKDCRCPNCGAKLNEHGYCVNCGTEPFEKRKEDNGSND